MTKYTILVTQTNEYVVEVEASSENDAIDLVRDFDGDEILEYETDARWDYLVVGEENG